jgi:hypothetical protein
MVLSHFSAMAIPEAIMQRMMMSGFIGAKLER